MLEQQHGGQCAQSEVNGGENRSKVIGVKRSRWRKEKSSGGKGGGHREGYEGHQLFPLCRRGTAMRGGSRRGLYFL